MWWKIAWCFAFLIQFSNVSIQPYNYRVLHHFNVS
jgi:hypothetical protein